METALPSCYRHPDRETRLSCSTCERPICVECMHTGSVGQKCPECAAPVGRNRVITAQDMRRAAHRSSPFSHAVIAVCLGLFAAGLLVPGLGRELQLHGAQINALVAEGEWWRLLTATLLHASIMHVGFNMWALWIFGPALEREVGTVPFATLYIASALAGGAFFFAQAPGSVAVGASGAIFGLFGAWLAASFRNRHTLQGQANLRTLLTLLAINLAISLMPGIAWQAHLGGLVAGFLIMLAWMPLDGHRRAALLRSLAGAAVGLLALAVVVVLV